jgi:hypothetical protein
MQTEIDTTITWTVVNGVIWPIDIMGLYSLSALWINFLARLVLSKPLLGDMPYPNYEYLQMFVWSVFVLGRAIVGFIVGLGQWLVLRKRYALSWHWIKLNFSLGLWVAGSAGQSLLSILTKTLLPLRLSR